MSPLTTGNSFKRQKKIRKSKLRSGPGCKCCPRNCNPFCVYIIIGHNNQIFKKKSCGPARLCPDNAFRVTALAEPSSPPAWPQSPSLAQTRSPSQPGCQAGLTPSQHASAAELVPVTRTRVTVGPVLAPAVPQPECRSHGQAPTVTAGPGQPGRGLVAETWHMMTSGSDSESLRLAAA